MAGGRPSDSRGGTCAFMARVAVGTIEKDEDNTSISGAGLVALLMTVLNAQDWRQNGESSGCSDTPLALLTLTSLSSQ